MKIQIVKRHPFRFWNPFENDTGLIFAISPLRLTHLHFSLQYKASVDVWVDV